MTRGQLAARLNVTAGAVSHWLNGNRPCPRETVLRIAKIIRADSGWLLSGTAASSLESALSTETRRPSPRLSWGFRQAPADGGKDFGNAAVYATPMSIRTIVREDGQNSLDATRGDDVVLRFRLVELSRTSKRYDRALDALAFGELKERISAIEQDDDYESKLGSKLSAGIETVSDERLVLLYIDDYHTRGLQGEETDSRQAFCALVRDNLNSRKESSTAGGVFGVGSKVNLACSNLSTVVFASKVKGAEKRGTRLIGRTELTYHEFGSGSRRKSYAGPGWFGVQSSREGLMESAWLADNDPVLDALMLRRDKLPKQVRPNEATGTSILVVGFTDPQTESGATTQQLADAFVEAAAVNFWPAMIRGSLTVIVERYLDDGEEPIKSEVVNPKDVAGVRELCDAYEQHIAGKVTPALVNPGDVTSVPIHITIPATRPRAKVARSHEEQVAECTLLVRLADPDSASGDPRVSHVAYTRGRAMITRYQSRSGVVGGRPFHAVVLAGSIVGASHESLMAEEFLRLAEPPAHDRWTYSIDLGERYARGAKKSLDEFHARVTEGLQRVLKPQVSRQGDGPEVLRRLLQIRAPKLEPVSQPAVRIARRTARVENGAWFVEAELSCSPTPRRLVVTPRLSFRCEGSAPIPVAWERIEVTDAVVTVDAGSLLLPPRVKRVAFRAWSDPSSHPVDARESSVVLDITARSEPGA